MSLTPAERVALADLEHPIRAAALKIQASERVRYERLTRDLLDAVDEHQAAHAYTAIGPTEVCVRCGLYWPCPTARARDALDAAPRGEQ